MKSTALFAAVLFSACAFAQGFLELPPGKWWKNEEVIRTLALSSEQQQKLDDIMYAHLEQMIDLKAAFEKEELRLKQMLDLPKVDEKKLLDQAQKALDAQNRMQMNRAAMFVKVRALLTPEQWDTIKAKFQERRHERMQEMRERRGQRGKPNPEAGAEPMPPGGEEGM
jgi:Spy/CpxP family protein refolding chaperone